jgi:hypothetical protein
MTGDSDRPRLSWREIDQRRDSAGPRPRPGERRARGQAAEARAVEATKEYLKEIDKMFVEGKGGAEGEALAKAVRDAHGTPELGEACQAYCEKLGLPTEVALLSIFLDANESELVIATLEHMLDLQRATSLEATQGLKAQLRTLAQSFDDSIAGAAEDLLDGL